MVLFYFALLACATHAASSWFSSEPDYVKWSHAELHTWLEQHNIKVPPSFDKPHLYDLVDANWNSLPSSLAACSEAGRQWSLDHYNRAQRAFEHIKDDSFDQWDESRLRAFLLEQGIVAPSGPRERLVLLAKNKYRAYTDVAALYSSLASASVSSTRACATDATHSASESIDNAVALVTHEITRTFDHTKDYFYSSWDDHRLRKWLEEHGSIEAKSANTKDELIRLANDYYRKTTSDAWESWSDSYIREWLVSHNVLKPTETPSRPNLFTQMKKYYYNFTDNIWNTWSNPELEAWLVDHNFLKSDTQRNRDELVKMVEEHYLSASNRVWEAWSDSDIRRRLLEHGYLEERNDIKSRKDLVDLMNSKYPEAMPNVASYLVWPDARLRVYLRERGVSESTLPTTRPGLLQETRIRWVQSSTTAENIFTRLKEIIDNSLEIAEEKVARALEVLNENSRDAARYASERVNDLRECAGVKKAHAWSWGSQKAKEVRQFEQKEGYQRAGSDRARENVQGDEL